MHKIYELKDMLCEELEEYGSKDKLDVGGLEIVDKLAHAIKNIDKIIETYEEEGYSNENRDGGMSNMYPYYYGDEGGRSYRDRGGSYARGRGRNARRDSIGRYSSEGRSNNRGYSRAEDDMQDMITELREMMPDLPQEKQREVQRFIQKIEQM